MPALSATPLLQSQALSTRRTGSTRAPRPAASGAKVARLPTTRPELLALHAAARARREAAPLGGEAYAAAAEEVARIEVAINKIDDPSP